MAAFSKAIPWKIIDPFHQVVWLSLVSEVFNLAQFGFKSRQPLYIFFLAVCRPKLIVHDRRGLFHLIGKLGHRVSCTVKGLAYGRLSLTKIFKG